MTRYGWLAAIALVLAVNALVLTGVRSNRIGAPEATLVLTERELPLARTGLADSENSGISLQLDWNNDSRQWDWFDRIKLEQLGFNVSPPSDAPDLWDYYRKALPRKAWVVLEYEGEAWESFRSTEEREIAEMESKLPQGETTNEELAKARRKYANLLRSGSRLFPIDVGPKPEELRLRYPDRSRYIVTAAKVRMNYSVPPRSIDPKAEARLRGFITEILVDRIQVPRRLQSSIPDIEKGRRIYPGVRYYSSDETPLPRYQVELRYGGRYEPWVEAIKTLVLTSLIGDWGELRLYRKGLVF